MIEIKRWSREDGEKLQRLAQEAIRCAIAATNNANYVVRAREALAEFQAKLIEIMQPPLVIDLIHQITDAAFHGGHLKITFPTD